MDTGTWEPCPDFPSRPSVAGLAREEPDVGRNDGPRHIRARIPGRGDGGHLRVATGLTLRTEQGCSTPSAPCQAAAAALGYTWDHRSCSPLSHRVQCVGGGEDPNPTLWGCGAQPRPQVWCMTAHGTGLGLLCRVPQPQGSGGVGTRPQEGTPGTSWELEVQALPRDVAQLPAAGQPSQGHLAKGSRRPGAPYSQEVPRGPSKGTGQALGPGTRRHAAALTYVWQGHLDIQGQGGALMTLPLGAEPRAGNTSLPHPSARQPAGLTVFPVLEGRRELFGSDPGDPSFLLGFLSRGEGRLGLGPRVGGPGETGNTEA